jgi:hypothetical protein
MLVATFALPGAGVAYAAGPGNGNVTGNNNTSLGSGNTITAPVSVPINLCGISAAILGFANAECHGGATVNTPPCTGKNCTPPCTVVTVTAARRPGSARDLPPRP